jgi:hypothetical protein
MTKYLTYTPWPGQLNNTRMCFETALVFAFLTRRTLVIPAGYRRATEPEVDGVTFRPLHPAECFTLDALRGIVPIIPREEYEDSPDRVDFVPEPGASVFCFPEIPPHNSAEDFRLRDFAVSRNRFFQITPAMEACRTLHLKPALLEHFYLFFHFSRQQDEIACKSLIRDRVRFKPAIVNAAAHIAKALGSYSAIHVRRNDFFTLCPHQNIPADRLLENIGHRIPAGSRLYIASDETDRTFFAAFRKRYELFFLDCFRDLQQRDFAPESSACVEQMVCASAGRFIGTNFSTFSAYIVRLRGYLGAADTNTYFTDGTPGSEMDEVGSPPFSWINWLLNGNPLWAREFREAWDFTSSEDHAPSAIR